MRITHTRIDGCYLLEHDVHRDVRGSFTRVFDRRELEVAGLEAGLAQASLSHNPIAGTLRGMHLQAAPHAEVKLVSCVRGAIFDVAVDLRAESPTYLAWHGIQLTERDGLSLYVPEGCAHGFLSLRKDSTVLYQISVSYDPNAGVGYRWNDPAFGIEWPAPPSVISRRDATYSDYR